MLNRLPRVMLNRLPRVMLNRLPLKRIAAILLFACGSVCLPAYGQTFSNALQRVPAPTAAGQEIVSIPGVTVPFSWQIETRPYSTNGSQMAVGGSVDATTRLSVSPQGTAENGGAFNLPAGSSGNGLVVKNNGNIVAILGRGSNADSLEINSLGGNLSELVNATGDFFLLGGTASSPRFFGGASGGVLRFSPGDPNQVIQGGSNQSLQISSFTPIVFYPGSHTIPPAFIGYSLTAPGAQFINAVASNPLMALQAASSQTADLLDFVTSTSANLAKVDKSGDIITTGYVNSPAYQVGGTAGYTGTIPTTAQSFHFVSGVLVGYVDSTGTLHGN